MQAQQIIDEVSNVALVEDESRFVGILYPETAHNRDKVYTIQCQMICTGQKEMPVVEVTYSLMDFNSGNGESILNIINWKNAIAPLCRTCVFDAKCEKLGENKYRLTKIHTVCYI